MSEDNSHTSHVSPLTSNDIGDVINLLDYLRVIYERKYIICIIVSIAFVASIIYSFSLTKIYASTASILPPQREGSGIVSQLAGGLGGLAGNFLGISSPPDMWMAILRSESIKDGVIKRFDLMNVFKTQNVEDARSILDGMVKISKSIEGVVSITVEDTDPQRAAMLANAYVEELDRINQGIVMTSGSRTRVFVEARLKEAGVELTKTEEAIRSFQEKNKAVQLDAQSSKVISAIGEVMGEVMAKEVELQTLLSYATANNPQAEILLTQVEELKKRLRELEEGNKLSGNPSATDFFIPTMKIPNLTLQYARLLRNAKVQETLYEFLTQQYEMARIQEAKDTPTVQLLDEAKVDKRRIRPQRKRIVLLSTVASGFFALFVVFVLEYLERFMARKKYSQS